MRSSRTPFSSPLVLTHMLSGRSWEGQGGCPFSADSTAPILCYMISTGTLLPPPPPNLRLLFLHVSRPEGPWAGVRHTLLCCSKAEADGIRGIWVTHTQPSASLPFARSDSFSVSVYIASEGGWFSLCILDNNRTELLSLMGRDVEGCEDEWAREEGGHKQCSCSLATLSPRWIVVAFGKAAAGFLHNPSHSLSLSLSLYSSPGTRVL